MLPAKNSAYQSFSPTNKIRSVGTSDSTNCEVARLHPVGGTAPHVAPVSTPVDDHGLAISFDVTDQEDLQRARKDIVSMVSHDLRSPLTALRVSVGMFLGGAFGEMSPEAVKRLDSMGGSVDLLIRMINDLLDVEKLEAGQFRFYIKPADSHVLMKSAVQAVTGIAEAKNIDIKMIGKNFSIEVDSDRVVQVLINLLSNAIKFSPVDSQIEIHASVRNGNAEFRVIDRGKGIPATHLRDVFKPYEQIDAYADIARMGSGLGLTISKRIIEAHGGSIGVHSEIGKGSQFWIRLKSKKA